jgi:Tfp pilus assembly protein FimT
MLVLAIVALLAAVAYPSLDSMYNDFKVSSAADKIQAAMAMGRLQAINEGRPYRFGVVPGKGNYRLAPDSSEFWAGNNGSSSTDSTDQPVILQDALPKGVRLALSDADVANDLMSADGSALPPDSVDPSQYQTIATFLPDGTSREDVRIVFSAKGAQSLVISLRGITGAVTVRPLTNNAQQAMGK